MDTHPIRHAGTLCRRYRAAPIVSAFLAFPRYHKQQGGSTMVVEELQTRPRGRATPAWGMLAAIDLDDCTKARIADGHCVRGFVAEVVAAIGMRAHGPTHLERFGAGALEGWSVLQFIETSSITVHADEVWCRCFVDVFSCQEFDPEIVARVARRWFGGTSRVTVLRRGRGDV
jgi:S-adenosylmethionine decarboxylase